MCKSIKAYKEKGGCVEKYISQDPTEKCERVRNRIASHCLHTDRAYEQAKKKAAIIARDNKTPESEAFIFKFSFKSLML